MEPVDPDPQVPGVAIADLERLGYELLIAIGEDPNREGLVDTPRRWAQFWSEFIDYEPGQLSRKFTSVTLDQMVVVTGIDVWSLCEHHLLPFSCRLSVGYLTTDEVLGLSKIVRVCHFAAHRLQLQERLVDNIADAIQGLTHTNSVAVVGTGEHLCMKMRGIKSSGSMITSVMRGVFLEKPEAREEFLRFHLNGTS